ncbi:uncharacterized protein METZ01_LOCUS197714 [marine metagenome]|uniref:Uncharacterized protein n=1 Tax=marine metagenome TaxID=408172 RepID=A0A382E2C1_9ZZZZ
MSKTNGIKTTKIGKKDYVEVDERIRLFWELHPTWSLITEMIYNCEENLVCIFKATIIDDNKEWRATGHAREFQADKKSMVNKTSHLENCETSAIGRACGVKGIITEYGLASANEVRDARKLEKELDELSAVKKVEFTAGGEQKVVPEKEDPIPDDMLTKDAPKEMIDKILGKSSNNTINDELISLNARAMKITTVEEGTAISDEYRKMVAAHGEDNLPKSLREVVVSSLNAARDKITRDQLA